MISVKALLVLPNVVTKIHISIVGVAGEPHGLVEAVVLRAMKMKIILLPFLLHMPLVWYVMLVKDSTIILPRMSLMILIISGRGEHGIHMGRDIAAVQEHVAAADIFKSNGQI